MEKSKELFQSTVDQGVVEGYYGLAVVAMNNLGYMYQHGNGAEQDYAKAIEWLTKAADLGNTNAMENLKILQGQ